MNEFVTRVREVQPETADAVTLRLDLAGSAFAYRPGQYVIIDPRQFEALQAANPSLGYYSLCSDALAADAVEIAVKAPRNGASGGALAPYLVREVRPGQRIVFVGPRGRYCLPEAPPEAIRGYLHLCAGSGVAPNRGMIRHALARGWPQRHLLLLQDRTEADVLFRREWQDLVEAYPDRLRVRHVLSAARGEYVTPDLIRDEMRGFLDPASTMALVCGPNRPRAGGEGPGFRDLWCGNPRRGIPCALEPLGFAADRILTETG